MQHAQKAADPWRRNREVPTSMYVCMYEHYCYGTPSRFLLRGAPDYSADTEVEFHAETHEQLRVKDLPRVPTQGWGGGKISFQWYSTMTETIKKYTRKLKREQSSTLAPGR